jgi:hypothetical protein
MAVVYQHRRLDNNNIFYIGIGKDKYRPYSKAGRSRYWKNIVAKCGYEVDVIIEGLSIEEAAVVEVGMIESYGRIDLNTGFLVNMTDGGQHGKGYSGTWLGKNLSEEHKEKLRQAKIGKTRNPHSEETKRKISERHKGRIVSEETKQKIREINLGKKHSEETKQKISSTFAAKRILKNQQNLSTAIKKTCYELLEKLTP